MSPNRHQRLAAQFCSECSMRRCFFFLPHRDAGRPSYQFFPRSLASQSSQWPVAGFWLGQPGSHASLTSLRAGCNRSETSCQRLSKYVLISCLFVPHRKSSVSRFFEKGSRCMARPSCRCELSPRGVHLTQSGTICCQHEARVGHQVAGVGAGRTAVSPHSTTLCRLCHG